MKGDFTRNTFKPTNHYSSVRSQQGRVQVDADWNEAVDILAHRDRTTRRDVIGLCGGPQGQDSAGNDLAGFLIEVVDGALQITKGRYYVNGLLVENDDEVVITEQPDLPYPPENTLQDVLVPAGEALDPGTYLAYLDVWERHITALEAPDIREVALGGPDATTRTKVVWQIRLMPAETPEDAPLHCASELSLWDQVTAPSSGRLSARAEPGEAETDPCEVPAQAGYRGLENQLYRVEVHRVNSANEITIKWSRENGSVAFGWTSQDNLNPNKLTLSSTGRDNVLGLATDDWVELTDDKHELRGEPGLLVKVVNVEGNVLTIDPGSETVDIDEFPVNPKVRRWDMPRDVGEISVDLSLIDNWIALENGVEVKLEPGTYRTGDYWLIPARTAMRDIEWPRDDANDPLPQPPHGIQHHYCRLALLSFDGEIWERLSDCRSLFPPLTEMIRFFHVSGDGQEAMPGQPVRRPLQVGVVNGHRPVAGARVQFEVVGGNGRLRAAGENPCSDFTAGGANAMVVETGPDGVAGCCWRLDAATLSQQVEATLLEIEGKPLVDGVGTPLLTPIRFNANLSVASQVAYDPRNCPDLGAAQTVQQAIDLLCQRPQGGGCCVTVGRGGEYERLDEAIEALLEQEQRDICICLLAGDHETVSPSIQLDLEERDLHITIHGCGLASRLVLTEKPWLFRGVQTVTLRDLAIEPAFQVNNVEGAISFRRCSQVTVTGCFISGFTPEGPLLSIVDADQVRLRDNILEASRFDSLEIPQKIFATAEIDFLADLFALPAQGEFRQAIFREGAFESAQQLAGEDPEKRKNMQVQIEEAMRDQELQSSMSSGERISIEKLSMNLIPEVVDPANMFDLLFDIRRAAIKSRPGVALILGSELDLVPPEDIELIAIDGHDYATLESNEIIGVLSLYGMPPVIDFIRETFNLEIQKQLEDQLRSGQISLRDGGGLLGTLQLHGNQLVRIAVASYIFERLLKMLEGDEEDRLLGLFNRYLIGDNVIEGGHNWVVCVHQSMTGNDFTMKATRFRGEIGMVIADSAVYVGNHSGDPGWVLRDISRNSSQAANLDMTID